MMRFADIDECPVSFNPDFVVVQPHPVRFDPDPYDAGVVVLAGVVTGLRHYNVKGAYRAKCHDCNQQNRDRLLHHASPPFSFRGVPTAYQILYKRTRIP